MQSARATLDELVMAWARDIATGVPRYIGEIDELHRGSKCGCECQSCGAALIAVNAAKDKVIKRPHFRHPEGALRDDCSILAARAAAIRLLELEGVIDLPKRRMSVTAQGLSGVVHEAWVEVPAQRVRVAAIDFRDRAYALLTLDDGRTLRVEMTGTVSEQAGDDGGTTLIPSITIDVDASVAGMDQDQIRQRLQLLPDKICWQSHWQDAVLLAEAQAKATEAALDALDWLPDDIVLPGDLSPSLKRESLLHHEVKRILESAGHLAVPAVEVVEELRTDGLPTLQRRWSIPNRVLTLSNTRLEHRLRPLIPDVLCEARGPDGQVFDPLIVEVTVTNVIDEERRERIRAQGVAALEIDLSRTGGRVTRVELNRLVLQEVSVKRWLHYPGLDAVRADLHGSMCTERDIRLEADRIAAQRRRRVLAAPLAEVAARYLAAAELMFDEQVRVAARSELRPKLAAAEAALAACVDDMAMKGFPEAGDEDLLGHHRILSRLLSIRANRGVGYAMNSAVEVLNAIRQSQPENRSDWSLYLIAVKAYLPSFSNDQRAGTWFDSWRDAVVEAVRAKDYRYMRSPKYDRLLTILLPEMANGLEKSFGRRPAVADLSWDSANRHFVHKFNDQPSRPAAFLTRGPRRPNPLRGDAGGDIKGWLLKGAELEAWRLANPETAKDWEDLLRRYGGSGVQDA